MAEINREALARSLAYTRRGVCAKVNDSDRIQADALLEDFLIVPRSEIEGTDYSAESAPGEYLMLYSDRAVAVNDAATRGVQAFERLRLPWTPITEDPVEPCSDCGLPYGRQADCRTCKGVPILEDGDGNG